MSANGCMQVKGDAADHVRHWLAIMCRHRWREHVVFNVDWPFYVGQINADREHLMLANRFVQAKGYASILCPIMIKLCAQAMADVGSPWPTSIERRVTGNYRCERSKTNVAWLMSLSIGGHHLLKEQMPWLMPTISWRWCGPIYSYTRWLMCACLGWATCHWPTSLARFSLDNVASHWPTLMSPSRCRHATSYAYRPWLMPPIVVRRRLPHDHMSLLLCDLLGDLDCVAWILIKRGRHNFSRYSQWTCITQICTLWM